MIRILHVINTMNCGGAETLIMNLYRNIDRTRIQFDFVLHTQQKSFYEDEILSMGGRIFRTTRYNILNASSYIHFWNTFFEEHPEYHIVHGHITSSASLYLKCAKKYDRYTIIHSHATGNSINPIHSFGFKIVTYPLRYMSDYYFACSHEAGITRFGKKVVASDRFHVLENGIDLSKYQYSDSDYCKKRDEDHIGPETLVIGHVGRFTEAKNHAFLIRVFEHLHNQYPNSLLRLVGAGELEEQIRHEVKALGLEECVDFRGLTNNIAEELLPMDVFVFPSVFEGLGIALVEAQTMGLPCVVSEKIQKEADIGAGLITTCELSEKAEAWIAAILDGKKNVKRKSQNEFARKAGFSIQETADYLSNFYSNRSK